MPRETAVAMVVVGVATTAVGFVPQFGGPGYEHSLASGLLVPGTAAVAAALAQRSTGTWSPSRSPLVDVLRGAALGATLGLVALATSLLHGLRVGICDLVGGVAHFALTAGAGAVLGGVWGVVAGELARALGRGRGASRGVAVGLALAAPIGGIALSVERFYGTPIIFAFDPFFGYFSGTLYDTVVDAGPALLWYRAGSAMTMAGTLLVAAALQRSSEAREGASASLRFTPGAASLAQRSVALVCFLGSLLVVVRGPSLGHLQTSATIREALGGFRQGRRCDVVFPQGQRPEDMVLLVKDCDDALADVERTLGQRGPERITAFFFRDGAEKRRLMGAESTYIAKPWRAEVYLQLAAYPHPVLGHELAHVVAGGFGRGPFRIAGALGGLWPNPGLIEGVAVAASPDDDELTDRQWARAMLDVGILPPLTQVFGMGFLGAHASKSYTVAGAFVAYLMETRGPPAVRRWYGGTSVEEAMGKDLVALDDEFRAALAREVLPTAALVHAKGKFERRGFFARKCPHVVDALRREADMCRDDHREAQALALYGQALARDPEDPSSRFGRALTEANLDRDPGRAAGRRALETLARGEGPDLAVAERANEALADLDALGGDGAAAAARYRDLAARAVDEDVARTFEVKALLAGDETHRRVLEGFLLRPTSRGPDLPLAMAQLLAPAGASPDAPPRDLLREPIVAYLLGKNLTRRGAFREAVPFLDEVLREGAAPTPRVGREAFRQRAIAACALGEGEVHARLRTQLDGAFAGGGGGRREWVTRLLRRCIPSL